MATKGSNTDQDKRETFGATENKDLASTTNETKEGDTISVVMLHHGEHDGKALLPGKTYDLPRAKANQIVSAKRGELASK